jgi:hypothetical protein
MSCSFLLVFVTTADFASSLTQTRAGLPTM